MDFRVRVCCVREMYVRWDILGENVWRVGDTSSHFSYSIADAFRVVCAGVHTTVAAGGCVDVGIAATDRWWACATLAATEAYRTGLDEIVGSAGLGGGGGVPNVRIEQSGDVQPQSQSQRYIASASQFVYVGPTPFVRGPSVEARSLMLRQSPWPEQLFSHEPFSCPGKIRVGWMRRWGAKGTCKA